MDGVRKIHLMRIIGIVEADFNQALKILFTRQLMWKTKASGITPNQWGGRANRLAPDCASRKVLTFGYKWFMRQPIGSLFGDLSSCFDRMFPKILNALAMKKGMTQSVCEHHCVQ